MNLAEHEDALTKYEELLYAKRAVEHCLQNKGNLTDMHGLTYWAERVEKLRNEIDI